MKDPFQKRPGAAFLAALGFVLFCILVGRALEPRPEADQLAAADEAPQ